MPLKPHICVTYACMNTSGGLRMCNFQLRFYISSKHPALYGRLTHGTTVIDTACTELSESCLSRGHPLLCLPIAVQH